MLNNETRRELLNRSRAVQFPGSIMEVYRAAEQGIDLLADHEAQMQQEMQVAQTPQQQETGLREEHARGNTQASMAFPNVQPNQSFNTEGMAAPINVDKYNNQGHLVESYKNVPPGIKDLPTGPYEGTVIETPAEYQKGGVKGRKGSTYMVDKMAVINDPVRNTQQFSNTPMYEGQHESTHLMADNNKDTAWPTLFQDENGNWFEGGYNEAKRRGEIYKFDSKKELIDFARKGNWKDTYQKGGYKQKKSNVRKRKYIKKYQNGGFEQQYKKGGSWTNWVNPLYLAERVKNQIPLNVRQFTADLVGSEDSINLNDLNWREKKALENARKRAEARGSSVIEYRDYGTHLTDPDKDDDWIDGVDYDKSNAYQSPHDDVGGGAGYQAVTKLHNPSYALKTTFGQMAFKKNKDGTYTYTDQYNFNNATGGGLKGWWEGAKEKGADLYGQARNIATNFGSPDKKGGEVKINMRNGGYRSKYPKGGLKLNSPLLKRNDFSLAKRNLEHNAIIPGEGDTGYSLVNRLEDVGENISKNFNLVTNPTLLNTKKLNLRGSFNADPGAGWDASNKRFSSFGSPTLNPNFGGNIQANYKLAKNVNLSGGANFGTFVGKGPSAQPYWAGLNIKLKRGGYRKKYL